MWVFLWLLLSAVLIGATIWSLQILLRQKRAWEAYAKAKNLTFKRGTFMGPAEITGNIGDYRLGFFTAEQDGGDIRTRRYVTVVEIELVEGIVNGAAMGSQEMLPFLKSLDRLHPYKIKSGKWDREKHHAFVMYDDVAESYLTDARVEAIDAILKTRNANVLVIFNDRQLVLRLETVDPIQDAAKMDKIVTRLMGLSDKLRISDEERKMHMAKAPVQMQVLHVQAPPPEAAAAAGAADTPPASSSASLPVREETGIAADAETGVPSDQAGSSKDGSS
ncbi:MAG: hypothetical protein WC989_00410 [Micavibrio sp.]